MQSRKPFTAIYTVHPYSVLLFSAVAGNLLVIDTHAVPKQNNGDDLHGAIVMSKHNETAISAIANWLFCRFCTGKFVQHELGVRPITELSTFIHNESGHGLCK